MQKIRFSLSAGVLLLILAILSVLFRNAPSMRASANADISILPDQSKITLDTKYVTTATVTGYIQGNTKGDYYLYGVDDAGLVIVQDGFDMTSTSFSLEIKARKAGTANLRICLAENKSKNIVAEATVAVTVNSYDTGKMKISAGRSSLSLYHGGKTHITVTVTNCPKGLATTTAWGRESGKATCLGAQWDGKITRDGTTLTGTLDLWGIAAGTDALTLSVKESNTGTVLCSAKIPVTVYDNLYRLSDTGEYIYDLADGDTFALYSKSYHNLMYPVNIRCVKPETLKYTNLLKDTANNIWTCTFKATQTGTYPITMNFYLNKGTSEQENWVKAGSQTYNVTVIDSREDASLAASADVMMFDYLRYTAAYYDKLPEGTGGYDDWYDWEDDWYSVPGEDGLYIGRPVRTENVSGSSTQLDKLNSYVIPVYLKHEFMFQGKYAEFLVNYDDDYITDVSFSTVTDNKKMENGTDAFVKYLVHFRVIQCGETYLNFSKENPLTEQKAEEHHMTLNIVPAEGENLSGDLDRNGQLTAADAVLMQKYLTAAPGTDLPDWTAGDLDQNGRLDAVDLSLLKALLLK